MNPVTHFLAGWAVGCTADLSRRDQALVCAASVAPDLDGLGLLFDIAAGHPEGEYAWYGQYHHVLGHNILFILCATILVAVFARRRKMTAFLAFVALELHILGDLVGARGPDGFQWPIPYLLPFTDRGELVWEGQWALNAWPNVVITLALVILTLFIAWRRGISPVGLFSERADRALVKTLRARFGEPKSPGITGVK